MGDPEFLYNGLAQLGLVPATETNVATTCFSVSRDQLEWTQGSLEAKLKDQLVTWEL
jgi:hypothetical protein